MGRTVALLFVVCLFVVGGLSEDADSDADGGHVFGNSTDGNSTDDCCACPPEHNETEHSQGSHEGSTHDGSPHDAGHGGGEHDICGHDHHEDPPYIIFSIFMLFVAGAIVRHQFKKPPLNKLPYTIVLFVIGCIVGGLSKAIGEPAEKYVLLADMNAHLIFYVFLPILIFESAFSLNWHVFKKVLGHCLALAGPGILLATALTATLVKLMFSSYEWSWITCILYGAIVSATDPVAVVALLKEVGAPEAISALIEGESLMNDGTAIVLFNVFKGMVCSGEFDQTFIELILELIKVAVGGPIVGLVIGMIAEWSLSKIFNDALVEIAVTLAAAYLTFFIAEGFLHVSGVLALVTLGLWLSHHRQAISPEVEHTLHGFWEMTVYLANTLIFALVGLVATTSKRFSNIDGTDVLYTLLAYAIITVVRAVLIAGFFKPLQRAKWKLERNAAVLVWWGGLRGAVGLSLTLMVADDEVIRMVHPELGNRFLFHVVVIVALTLVVNGISCQFVVAKLGLSSVPLAQKRLFTRCFGEIIETQHDTITELKVNPMLKDVNWQLVNRYTYEELRNPYQPTEKDIENDVSLPGEAARRTYLKVVKQSVWDQYEHGLIQAETIPRVVKFAERAGDIPGKLIDHSVLFKYWNESYIASTISGFSLSLPCCHSRLSKISAAWKEQRWAAGFDVATSLIRCHEDVLSRIDSLVEDRKEANKIKSHCKHLKTACYTQIEELSAERGHLAVAIQTRHAARRVLNAARSSIQHMQHVGMLSHEDAHEVVKLIETRMDRLARAPRNMPRTDTTELLQDEVSWMRKVEFSCIQEFKANTQEYRARKHEKIISKINAATGFYIVVNGVARSRTKSLDSLYGAGDCLFVSNVLCSSPKFVEVFAETDMSILWVTKDVVDSLVAKYSQLSRELWHCAGMEAAHIALHAEEPFSSWSRLELLKFVKTGTITASGQSGKEDTIDKLLHAGAYHILVEGSITVSGRMISETQLINTTGQSITSSVVMSPNSYIFSISDPLSVQAKARKRWGIIRSKLKQIINPLGIGSPLTTTNVGVAVFDPPNGGDMVEPLLDREMDELEKVDEFYE
eukprot:TRINITY_DN3489_c0_g1_i1.p1 TRINITY_DN3489_c0_g1~~TRINITY_DN3489_c0_g1_i1.p1  ORF type:complete len:1104 (+),score=189.70 TRINITY_DN3489_c0_g1_i1:72-3314(+)